MSAASSRPDTRRQGLLFAGTESFVYVSFDDGDHWQSLALNLPNTSYRDMVVKGNDLVVGTYGRGFWILDDISPLRQITQANASAPALKPTTASRAWSAKACASIITSSRPPAEAAWTRCA